jgi:hypothetical protein
MLSQHATLPSSLENITVFISLVLYTIVIGCAHIVNRLMVLELYLLYDKIKYEIKHVNLHPFILVRFS